MGEILKPEEFTLHLCPWIQLHKERDDGTKSFLTIGEDTGVIIQFQFGKWIFVSPTTGFFIEFGRYFLDRIVVLDVYACEKCQEELDEKLNAEIVEAGCIPPKE